jgi:cob(I)alamin adenosyltransferase
MRFQTICVIAIALFITSCKSCSNNCKNLEKNKRELIKVGDDISKLEDDIETKYQANLDNCIEKEKDAKNESIINGLRKLAQPEKYAQAIEEAEKNVIEANSVLATKERELEKLKEKKVKLEEQINSCNS